MHILLKHYSTNCVRCITAKDILNLGIEKISNTFLCWQLVIICEEHLRCLGQGTDRKRTKNGSISPMNSENTEIFKMVKYRNKEELAGLFRVFNYINPKFKAGYSYIYATI